jgi:hypothetical protein
MSSGFRLLETTAYRAPLSLQFVDSVGGTLIADGLSVTAWPAGDPEAGRTAQRSPVSTILGFGRLPGLLFYEEATLDSPPSPGWSPPGPGRPFVVRVQDTLGRYLPELLALTLPQASLVSPALFSAPSRPAPSGWAVVRGEVWSQSTTTPASWAIVTVLPGSTAYQAMADGLGRFVLYLPYPEALPPLTLPPPAGGTGPLTWPLTVSVAYQPLAQMTLADAGASDPPEFSSLLLQGQAGLATTGGPHPSISETLTFGAPLVLRLQVVLA